MRLLLLPTLIQILAGGLLFFFFRRRVRWKDQRSLRLAALSAIFISLILYSAAIVTTQATGAQIATCLLLVFLVYAPTISLLISQEAASILPAEVERQAEVAWTWRVRRRLLFGSEVRRRRLWQRKRRRLPQHSTDPILRLELLELSIGLGEYGEALYHAHALDELLPTGEIHAYALHRMAHVLAERQQRLGAAQPTLHRLIRLYPISEHRDDAERLIRLFEEAH